MIAEIFTAIKAAFGAGPDTRADEIERFRARNRMLARQQRTASPQAGDNQESEGEEPADDRRRKVSKARRVYVRQYPQKYTASTYQSYLAPGLQQTPDSPSLDEAHPMHMLNAFDFNESPEAFMFEDEADMYASGAAAGGDNQHEEEEEEEEDKSLWRRRFPLDINNNTNCSSISAPRKSPKLGADALWDTHYRDAAYNSTMSFDDY